MVVTGINTGDIGVVVTVLKISTGRTMVVRALVLVLVTPLALTMLSLVSHTSSYMQLMFMIEITY